MRTTTYGAVIKRDYHALNCFPDIFVFRSLIFMILICSISKQTENVSLEVSLTHHIAVSVHMKFINSLFQETTVISKNSKNVFSLLLIVFFVDLQ